MHTYDPSRHRPTYQTPIPSMRTAPDTTGERSATPIYDTLYSEYRRAFRALPGDRTGEENLGFTAFGTGPYGMQHRGDGRYDSRPDPRQNSFGQFHGGRYGQHDHYATGQHHVPAALPPAPRRGL
ncbi:hypothetical protein DMA15_07360 [Streptomyces sp. WAC 01529]|uniref:hypothetical protein n=1 Tax=Streptomyces sp. WAC 01529 TaxID=2203205 RepID=UPI000F6B8B4C|nr:hypothetical protein [Streptomyces sp. WAC 01529]AZM52441.1 hypothetical protein DMA15_07360 [Streptomyces sp. WAC 01529]